MDKTIVVQGFIIEPDFHNPKKKNVEGISLLTPTFFRKVSEEGEARNFLYFQRPTKRDIRGDVILILGPPRADSYSHGNLYDATFYLTDRLHLEGGGIATYNIVGDANDISQITLRSDEESSYSFDVPRNSFEAFQIMRAINFLDGVHGKIARD